MKSKIILSSLVLLFFSLLAGGSIDKDQENAFVILIAVAVIAFIIIAIIVSIVESKNKKKRLKMIKDDEQNSSDFDRSVSIGDDRCKLYFDEAKKKVMIVQITTEDITKKYVDDFEFPGKSLARYKDGIYYVYEPVSRRLLHGVYGSNVITEFEKLENISKDSNLTTKEPIAPSFNYLHTTSYGSFTNETREFFVLVDEHHGLIAIAEQGKFKYAFNYIKVEKLPEKTGLESTISVKKAGNYMFIMDNYFKVLVIIGKYIHKSLNYSDIIEVSYIENGDQLFTKSTGRTVGGAIVGGVLMGGAGAVVGGLSGDSKQNKVVKNMDIKILLRSTEQTSCVLHFMDSSTPLKTKEASDKSRYEDFLKNANKAKDLLSIIIDDAKQMAAQVAPIMSHQPSSIADELTKLAKLKADGILTEEEFVVQKKILLGGNVAVKGHEDNNAITASELTTPTEERHICGVCGYIMNGEVPEKCPICKSPSTKFNVL